MLKAMQLQQTNRPVDVILHWSKEDGALFLDPPYQRGDVWGVKRRVNLIRSILLRVPIPSLIINDRMGAGWKNDRRIAVIDGKQRITTILMFLQNQFAVPGEWFGVDSVNTTFSELDDDTQFEFRHMPLAFSEGRLKTLAMEQEVFDLVNFGGLRQGEKDSD